MGDGCPMPLQLEEELSDIDVPLNQDREQSIRREFGDHSQSVLEFDDSEAEVTTSTGVAQTIAALDHRRYQGCNAFGVDTIRCSTVDWQSVSPQYDDGLHSRTVSQNLDHVSYRRHGRQARSANC